jgi:hypothetical protein
MGKVADGRAIIVNCSRCDEPIIEGNSDGLTVRLSRFSVPFKDAMVLGKYGRIVFNVWIGVSGLYVSYFHVSPKAEPPDSGRLYSNHYCVGRR